MSTRCKRFLEWMRTNLLLVLTMAGVTTGCVLGVFIRPLELSKTSLLWIGMCGELYVRFMKMMVIPFAVSSIISSTASLKPRSSGKMGCIILSYLVLTNILGCIVGCVLALSLNPAYDTAEGNHIELQTNLSTDVNDVFADFLRNLIPDNIMRSSFQQTKTKYEFVAGTNESEAVRKAVLSYNDGPNMLGLIMISMLLGISASTLQEQGSAFHQFFIATYDTILQLMKIFMWSTPLCLISLISTTIASADDIWEDFESLGVYVITAVGGQMIFWLLFVPLGYVIVKRQNPFFMYYILSEPMLISSATGSTALAISKTIQIIESHLKVDNRVAAFVVPFSTTIGRCGSSIYTATSCVFILKTATGGSDAEQVALICILASLLSLATPSVIGASLLTIMLILASVDVPPEATAILISTDWFLDRLRTGTNFIVQILGHVITDKYCKLSDNTSDTTDGTTDNIDIA